MGEQNLLFRAFPPQNAAAAEMYKLNCKIVLTMDVFSYNSGEFKS